MGADKSGSENLGSEKPTDDETMGSERPARSGRKNEWRRINERREPRPEKYCGFHQPGNR
jgi:hypothetical protein